MNRPLYIIALFTLTAAMALLDSCLKEPDDAIGIINGGSPVIQNDSIGKVKSHSIEVFAVVARQNGSRVDSCGFYIIKDGTTDTTSVSFRPEAGAKAPIAFNTVVKNLSINTSYRIIAYAGNSEGLSLGKLQKATTLNGAGLITTIVPPDSIAGTSALAGGRIEDRGDADISEYGLIFSKGEAMTIADTIIATSMKGDSFLIKLEELSPGSAYYVQAFAKSLFGIFKGAVVPIVTRSGGPVLGELKLGEPQFRDISYSASVLADGNAEITEKGICWTEYPGIPTIANSKKIDYSEDFKGSIDGLMPGVHYNARAYATNMYGVAYSETIDFVTMNDYSIVQMEEFFNIADAMVFARAKIVVNSGIIEIGGFCWATHPEPTIQKDSISIVSPIGNIGSFSGAITKLKGNTTYYVRAFIQTASGSTGYSNVLTITTPPIFETVATFPGGTRLPNSVASFTVPGSINTTYILGGDKGSDLTNELWAYNLGDRWDQMAYFPGGSKKWQTAVVSTPTNGAYIFGGVDNANVATNSLYCYNPLNNTWELITKEGDAIWPTPVHSAVGVAYFYNTCFIGGNRNGAISNEVWVYNTRYSTWERKNDFPVRQYKGIAVNQPYTGMFYAGLGLTDLAGTTSDKRLWSYTNKPSDDVWREETVFPGDGQIRSAIYHKESIYMIDDTGQIWRYDLTGRFWEKKSLLPISNRGDYQHTMFVLDNTIYIGFGPSYRSLIKYDISWDAY
ncbi:MAG: hypothetical protein LBH04_06470 [Tannerellaceae bacterium]|jgi:hypothetical protein|nr:hypothetical protein [Tannerellaceae bacterium]